MRAKDTIKKAMKRGKSERGLRIAKPNDILSRSHISKSDHNLVVMTDLNKLGHEDWTVITAYYAMYHSALALLVRIGLESKDHATTAAILEYFFSEQISKELLSKFNQLKEKKDKIEALTIEKRYVNYLWKVKRAREAVQYGVSINYREKDTIVSNARGFVNKIKLVLNELDEELLRLVVKRINELSSRQ